MKNSWLKARVLSLLALHPWNEIVIVRCRAQSPFCIHFQFFPAFLGGHCAKPRVAWRENRREADAEGFGRAEVEHLARRAGLVSCPSSFSLIPTYPGWSRVRSNWRNNRLITQQARAQTRAHFDGWGHWVVKFFYNEPLSWPCPNLGPSRFLE